MTRVSDEYFRTLGIVVLNTFREYVRNSNRDCRTREARPRTVGTQSPTTRAESARKPKSVGARPRSRQLLFAA